MFWNKLLFNNKELKLISDKKLYFARKGTVYHLKSIYGTVINNKETRLNYMCYKHTFVLGFFRVSGSSRVRAYPTRYPTRFTRKIEYTQLEPDPVYSKNRVYSTRTRPDLRDFWQKIVEKQLFNYFFNILTHLM